MIIEPLLKLLQDWTNRIPLIILGSGASVPFNLPSMWKLGEYLKESISFSDKDDQEQFDEFKSKLDRYGDLEKTLLDIQIRESVLKQIVYRTWELINQYDLEAYDKILKLDDFPLSILLKHLLFTSSKKVSIVTTNYDRIAEYAASLAGAFICNGFAQNYIGRFSSTNQLANLGKLPGYNGQVNILKVHGSLDWFHTIDGQEIQLPLKTKVPGGLAPSIVTPGLSKFLLTHSDPYRTIFTMADREIDLANGYLCIGYGFNDEHVQPRLIAQIKNSKPIVVITKTLSEKCKELVMNDKCKNYVLIEEDSNPANTKIYSSALGDLIIPDVKIWQLEDYLKLIL